MYTHFLNLRLAGHPIAGALNEYHKAHDTERVQSQMFDLQLELQVDPKTAERIYQLHSQKQDAVEREDYDEAKRLKDCIGRLKQVGQKLAQLEAQKKVTTCNTCHAHALLASSIRPLVLAAGRR